MSIKRFLYRTEVNAPLERIAAFYQRADTFERLTPPLVWLQMHCNEGVAEGTVAEFTMWLGPLPVRWKALHSEVDWRQGFTDTQIQGPFVSWVHRHSFQSSGAESVAIVDTIEVEYGQGWYAGLASRLMWLGLPMLFAYRAWATRRQVGRMSPERANRGPEAGI